MRLDSQMKYWRAGLMEFNIKQIEKEVNYIFSSYPNHDMISMSKAQSYWLINRVKALEDELVSGCIHCNRKGFNGLDACDKCDCGKLLRLEQQNKRYREVIDEIREYITGCEKVDTEVVSYVIGDIIDEAGEVTEIGRAHV